MINIFTSKPVQNTHIKEVVHLFEVIRLLAVCDADSRIQFCRNTNWDVLKMLVSFAIQDFNSLLVCKALLTLAALSASNDTASTISIMLVEFDVIKLIAKVQKIEENGIKMKTSPIISAIVEVLSSIIYRTKVEKAQKANILQHLAFVIQSILLVCYDSR